MNKALKLIGLCCIVVTIISGCLGEKKGSQQSLLTVNDYHISVEQYKLYVDLNSSKRSLYTEEQFMVNLQEQIVEDTMILELATEAGIIDGATYEHYMDEYNKENKRRSTAIGNGEVVYGPTQLDLRMFYSYFFANVSAQTINALIEQKKINLDDQSIFMRLNQSETSLEDRLMIQWASMPYTKNNQADVLKQMNELQNLVERGDSLEQATKHLQIDLVEVELTSAVKKSTVLVYPNVIQQAMSLTEGHYSELIEENDSYHLIYGMKQNMVEVHHLEDLVKKDLATEQVTKLIKEKIKAAEINAEQKKIQQWLREWNK